MTQPTKREQLAAMRLEDFKAHSSHNRWRIFRTNQRRTTTESIACAQSQEEEKEAMRSWHPFVVT
jgi:hypothetical protein